MEYWSERMCPIQQIVPQDRHHIMFNEEFAYSNNEPYSDAIFYDQFAKSIMVSQINDIAIPQVDLNHSNPQNFFAVQPPSYQNPSVNYGVQSSSQQFNDVPYIQQNIEPQYLNYSQPSGGVQYMSIHEPSLPDICNILDIEKLVTQPPPVQHLRESCRFNEYDNISNIVSDMQHTFSSFDMHESKSSTFSDSNMGPPTLTPQKRAIPSVVSNVNGTTSHEAKSAVQAYQSTVPEGIRGAMPPPPSPARSPMNRPSSRCGTSTSSRYASRAFRECTPVPCRTDRRGTGHYERFREETTSIKREKREDTPFPDFLERKRDERRGTREGTPAPWSTGETRSRNFSTTYHDRNKRAAHSTSRNYERRQVCRIQSTQEQRNQRLGLISGFSEGRSQAMKILSSLNTCDGYSCREMACDDLTVRLKHMQYCQIWHEVACHVCKETIEKAKHASSCKDPLCYELLCQDPHNRRQKFTRLHEVAQATKVKQESIHSVTPSPNVNLIINQQCTTRSPSATQQKISQSSQNTPLLFPVNSTPVESTLGNPDLPQYPGAYGQMNVKSAPQYVGNSMNRSNSTIPQYQKTNNPNSFYTPHSTRTSQQTSKSTGQYRRNNYQGLNNSTPKYSNASNVFTGKHSETLVDSQTHLRAQVSGSTNLPQFRESLPKFRHMQADVQESLQVPKTKGDLVDHSLRTTLNNVDSVNHHSNPFQHTEYISQAQNTHSSSVTPCSISEHLYPPLSGPQSRASIYPTPQAQVQAPQESSFNYSACRYETGHYSGSLKNQQRSYYNNSDCTPKLTSSTRTPQDTSVNLAQKQDEFSQQQTGPMLMEYESGELDFSHLENLYEEILDINPLQIQEDHGHFFS